MARFLARLILFFYFLQASEIGGVLNKLWMSDDGDSSDIIDEFVMQVALEPIRVSASGFFDINRDVVTAVRRNGHRTKATDYV